MKVTLDLGDSRGSAKLAGLLNDQIDGWAKRIETLTNAADANFVGRHYGREDLLDWARDDLAFYTRLRDQLDEQRKAAMR